MQLTDLKRFRMYEDVVALALLLPLDPTLRLPSNCGVPESLCLQHCLRILETCESYQRTCPAGCASVFDIYPLYHAASITLVHTTFGQHASYILKRTCSLLSHYTDRFPLASYSLQALRRMAIHLGLQLSDTALTPSRRMESLTTNPVDVPVALVLPLSRAALKDVPEEKKTGIYQMGIEVGEFISSFTDHVGRV